MYSTRKTLILGDIERPGGARKITAIKRKSDNKRKGPGQV